jgi:hypothetical protein
MEEVTMSPETSQSIQLPDGRRLSFAEYGVADGTPVFLFHGIPGSRPLHHPDEDIGGAWGCD